MNNYSKIYKTKFKEFLTPLGYKNKGKYFYKWYDDCIIVIASQMEIYLGIDSSVEFYARTIHLYNSGYINDDLPFVARENLRYISDLVFEAKLLDNYEINYADTYRTKIDRAQGYRTNGTIGYDYLNISPLQDEYYAKMYNKARDINLKYTVIDNDEIFNKIVDTAIIDFSETIIPHLEYQIDVNNYKEIIIAKRKNQLFRKYNDYEFSDIDELLDGLTVEQSLKSYEFRHATKLLDMYIGRHNHLIQLYESDIEELKSYKADKSSEFYSIHRRDYRDKSAKEFAEIQTKKVKGWLEEENKKRSKLLELVDAILDDDYDYIDDYLKENEDITRDYFKNTLGFK